MSALDIGSGYVPDFICNEVLPNLPRQSGEGIHCALFNLARVVTPFRIEAAIEAVLHNYAAQCARRVPESEIKAAIRDGKRYAWRPDSRGLQSMRTRHFLLRQSSSLKYSRRSSPAHAGLTLTGLRNGHR